jgi:hypothetical protein
VAYLCTYMDTSVDYLLQTCYLYFLVGLQQELLFGNNTIFSVLSIVLYDLDIVPR